MAEAAKTTDHETIRRWVEQRKGHPATVKATKEGDEPGLLRIDFPDYSGERTLEAISWEEFFDKFDREHLAFLYQEETDDGQTSRFCKFVEAET